MNVRHGECVLARVRCRGIRGLVSAGVMLASLSVHANVVITGELPPHSSRQLEGGGALASKVLTTLQDVGYPALTVSYQPWPRGLKNIELGNAIAAFPFTWTNARSDRLLFSTPIAFDIQSWYTTVDKHVLETTPWTLRRACVPKGWYSDAIEQVVMHQQLIVRTTNRLDQCLALLQKGKIDLVPINDSSLPRLSLVADGHIVRLSAFRQNVTFYLITTRDKEGERLLRAFNARWNAAAY